MLALRREAPRPTQQKRPSLGARLARRFGVRTQPATPSTYQRCLAIHIHCAGPHSAPH